MTLSKREIREEAIALREALVTRNDAAIRKLEEAIDSKDLARAEELYAVIVDRWIRIERFSDDVFSNSADLKEKREENLFIDDYFWTKDFIISKVNSFFKEERSFDLNFIDPYLTQPEDTNDVLGPVVSSDILQSSLILQDESIFNPNNSIENIVFLDYNDEQPEVTTTVLGPVVSSDILQDDYIEQPEDTNVVPDPAVSSDNPPKFINPLSESINDSIILNKNKFFSDVEDNESIENPAAHPLLIQDEQTKVCCLPPLQPSSSVIRVSMELQMESPFLNSSQPERPSESPPLHPNSSKEIVSTFRNQLQSHPVDNSSVEMESILDNPSFPDPILHYPSEITSSSILFYFSKRELLHDSPSLKTNHKKPRSSLVAGHTRPSSFHRIPNVCFPHPLYRYPSSTIIYVAVELQMGSPFPESSQIEFQIESTLLHPHSSKEILTTFRNHLQSHPVNNLSVEMENRAEIPSIFNSFIQSQRKSTQSSILFYSSKLKSGHTWQSLLYSKPKYSFILLPFIRIPHQGIQDHVIKQTRTRRRPRPPVCWDLPSRTRTDYKLSSVPDHGDNKATSSTQSHSWRHRRWKYFEFLLLELTACYP